MVKRSLSCNQLLKMKKNSIIIVVVIAIVGIAFVLRVFLPFHHVNTDNGIMLNTVDAYYQVRYADLQPDEYFTDYFVNYPSAAQTNKVPVFSQIIQWYSSIFQIDHIAAAAQLPVVLFFLTLIAFTITSAALFNNRFITIMSLGLVCIMPGEFLARTMLGSGDNHCWEIFLLSLIMMFSILSTRNFEIPWKAGLYFLPILVLLPLYQTSWLGARIVPVIVAVFLFVHFLMQTTGKMRLLPIGIAIAAPAIYFAIVPATGLNAIQQFTYMFGIDSTELIGEGMPLFFTLGQIDLGTIWNYFGITFYLALIGLGMVLFSYVKHNNTEYLFFIVWTVLILLLTLASRRYDYYLAINVSLLTAYVVYRVFKFIATTRYRSIQTAFLGIILVAVPLVRSSTALADSDYGIMSEDWQETTTWLRQYSNEQEYLTGAKGNFCVLTYRDYGYWIITVSHLPVITTPGTGEESKASKMLAEQDEQAFINKCKEEKVRFIVVSKSMTQEQMYPMLVRAGEVRIGQPFTKLEELRNMEVNRLYDEMSNIKKVFTSTDSEVKVFEIP